MGHSAMTMISNPGPYKGPEVVCLVENRAATGQLDPQC